MFGSMRRVTLLAALALVAVLAVGVAAAGAHGGRGSGSNGARASALVTEAAKQLAVTRPALVAAIQKAALARIDQAVEDEDIEADRARALKEEAQDDLRSAMALSPTRAVASNLGITTTRLNAAFRAARKALIIRRIDAAVANGGLEAGEAAELKAELDEDDLPGYKAGRPGFGGHGGPGGRR